VNDKDKGAACRTKMVQAYRNNEKKLLLGLYSDLSSTNTDNSSAKRR